MFVIVQKLEVQYLAHRQIVFYSKTDGLEIMFELDSLDRSIGDVKGFSIISEF